MALLYRPDCTGRAQQARRDRRLGRAGQRQNHGVKVGRHREDKKWFDRIREPFYKAFEGQPADGSGGKPDAVTTATVSSRAMIDDVFGACRTVMELPGVRELLAAGAAADKTAPAQN